MLYTLGEHKVQMRGRCFIAPGAHLIGKTIIEDNVSIWFNSVIRGDSDLLHIHSGTNIQDNCVVHTDEGIAVNIGQGVSIGHSCVIHGARIGDNSLIGMHSTILNHAKIGQNCIIGAHTLVTQGMQIPDNSLALGIPAKVIRCLTDEEIQRNLVNAQIYIDRATQYLNHFAVEKT